MVLYYSKNYVKAFFGEISAICKYFPQIIGSESRRFVDKVDSFDMNLFEESYKVFLNIVEDRAFVLNPWKFLLLFHFNWFIMDLLRLLVYCKLGNLVLFG